MDAAKLLCVLDTGVRNVWQLEPRCLAFGTHLHQQIERHGCDVTHETLRRGSPQALVCRKTRASWERKRKQYDQDLRSLRDLDVLTIPRRS